MGPDSILTTVKKLLGIEEEYDVFDQDLIMHINSVFAILNQIGVGPKEGFMITDKTPTWNDFLGDDPRINTAISYVYLKVKLLFDPPSGSSMIESMNRLISEFEWRLMVATDPVAVETAKRKEGSL